MWGRAALVGASGFVGGALSRQRRFDAVYDSRSIDAIADETFDTVVCAGAPSIMWRANADPAGDLANLELLVARLTSARIGRLVLISTIAVYADPGRGDSEADGVFETAKAYGANRRWLETELAAAMPTTIMRLPALYGAGLKKNFLFDLLNPVPSFLKPDRFEALRATLRRAEQSALDRAYDWDAALEMWVLDRSRLAGDAALTQVVAASPFAARSFTNADSTFQYHGVDRLADDIETAVAARLAEVNLVSEPWRAGALHAALLGEPFVNAAPSETHEAVRTVHADAFGAQGPWLMTADEVLAGIRAFFAEAQVQ